MILITLFAAMTAQAEAKTMAHDDWHHTNIVAVGGPVAGDPAHYLTVQAGDLDGDGRADDAYLKLACDGGALTQAYYSIKAPRDVATGQSSGRRMHKPLKITKEWGPASPMLAKMKPTYDVKMQKGARTASGGGWTPIGLSNSDGLCAAAAEASKTVTKTSSNIQNN